MHGMGMEPHLLAVHLLKVYPGLGLQLSNLRKTLQQQAAQLQALPIIGLRNGLAAWQKCHARDSWGPWDHACV
eukprot:scaffold213354_cov39-Prasinocladus_malaysianus.AAC.1